LIPDREIEYLFVGTFNPEWNYNNAQQADYFYGRVRNNFWCILPKVFGDESLKYEELIFKLDYINQNRIGITDIVRNVINANEENIIDRNNLTTGFSDIVLNQYNLEFNTPNILELIDKNKSTLKGVFLTRSTLNGINQIANEWDKIVFHCNKYSINTDRLLTPSRGGCLSKVEIWRNKILNNN
ncbi:MAG TPA: hypothetical protein PLD18_12000, partial [Flavobacterium sp.]|nr:hypothetical protein [Flavobacterium sp.]